MKKLASLLTINEIVPTSGSNPSKRTHQLIATLAMHHQFMRYGEHYYSKY